MTNTPMTFGGSSNSQSPYNVGQKVHVGALTAAKMASMAKMAFDVGKQLYNIGRAAPPLLAL